MRHVLSALVMNQPGVLAHISGMLASRAFNIESLAVGATENPELSRMTFVVNGDEKTLDQVRKQLEKIVTVNYYGGPIFVFELTMGFSLLRKGLCHQTVASTPSGRGSHGR